MAPNKKLSYCSSCGVGPIIGPGPISLLTGQPVLCKHCLTDAQKREQNTEPKLKLYKLYIYDPPHASSMGRKTAVMYVLGKSEPSTVVAVEDWIREEKDDWTHNTQITSIKELTGPFDHGHVIYFGDITDKR